MASAVEMYAETYDRVRASLCPEHGLGGGSEALALYAHHVTETVLGFRLGSAQVDQLLARARGEAATPSTEGR